MNRNLPGRTSISLDCKPENIGELRRWMENIARCRGLNMRAVNDLKFAAVELFTNAIRHARAAETFSLFAAARPEKHEDIRGTEIYPALRFLAIYQDPDFNPAEIQAPTLEEACEGGYGVFLARNLTSSFRIFKCSNGQVMIYFCSEPTDSRCLDNPKSYHYELPEEAIAQHPAEPRDSSRLLHISSSVPHFRDSIFRDIVDIIEPGSILVLNDTRVLKARLRGNKSTGAAVEVFMLRKLQDSLSENADTRLVWEVLLKPGRRLKTGDEIHFSGGITAHVLDNAADDIIDAGVNVEVAKPAGARRLRFSRDPIPYMERHGEMPLPPYITENLKKPERYQTVFACHEGAVAAPTAGLHFTPDLMKRLEDKGVQFEYITLHTGAGTFMPVRARRMSEHLIHHEWVEISESAACRINRHLEDNRRVIACGTTVVRALEFFGMSGRLHPGSGWCDLYILPGFKFQIVQGLITNFHLPGTTLLALVCALGGYETIMQAYEYAIRNGYRFYSFGDAMIIMNQGP